MKTPNWLKIASFNTLTASLSFSIAFSPLVVYAASTQDQQNLQQQISNSGLTQEQRKEMVQRAYNDAKRSATAATMQNNFNVAMAYLAKGDQKNAEFYLLNGATSNARAHILQDQTIANISNLLQRDFPSKDTKDNSLYAPLAAVITTDRIQQAIDQYQGTPLDAPSVGASFPGISLTPDPSSISGTASITDSSDVQVRQLTDLMKTNPDIRSAMYAVAQDRLADIGKNPPSYLPNDPSAADYSVCNMSSWLCQALRLGGVLNANYTQIVAQQKNVFNGISVDELAQAAVDRGVLFSRVAGATREAFKGYYTLQNPTPDSGGIQWIGQIIPDYSTNFAFYASTFAMVAQIAAIYNYRLSQQDLITVGLGLLAVASIIQPIAAAKNLNTDQIIKQVGDSDLVKWMGSSLANMKFFKKKSASKVMDDQAKDKPELKQELLAAADKSKVVVAGLGQEDARAQEEEKTKLKKDVDPFPNPNGPDAPAPAPVPAPTTPPAPGQPQKPDPTKIFNEALAKLKAAAFAKTLGGVPILAKTFMAQQGAAWLAQTVGAVAISVFKKAYVEERRLQTKRFGEYLYGSNNKNFFKLLILSQSPNQLVLKAPPQTSSSTSSTLPAVPAATIPQPASPSQDNPNAQYFPFAASTGNASITISPSEGPLKVGGAAYEFILRYARNFRICSKKDISDANTYAPAVAKLFRKHKSLRPMDSFLNSPLDTSSAYLADESKVSDFDLIRSRVKDSRFKASFSSAIKAHDINLEEAKQIGLVRDCYTVASTAVYDQLVKEMITYVSFNDENVASLRTADLYVRMRMFEVIEQLLYLNGPPDSSVDTFKKNVRSILGLEADNFANYFEFYEKALTATFVKDPISETGFKLLSLSSDNPYDSTVAESLRPEEPQQLHPIDKPTTGYGSSTGGGSVFSSSTGGGSTGPVFDAGKN